MKITIARLAAMLVYKYSKHSMDCLDEIKMVINMLADIYKDDKEIYNFCVDNYNHIQECIDDYNDEYEYSNAIATHIELILLRREEEGIKLV